MFASSSHTPTASCSCAGSLSVVWLNLREYSQQSTDGRHWQFFRHNRTATLCPWCSLIRRMSFFIGRILHFIGFNVFEPTLQVEYIFLWFLTPLLNYTVGVDECHLSPVDRWAWASISLCFLKAEWASAVVNSLMEFDATARAETGRLHENIWSRTFELQWRGCLCILHAVSVSSLTDPIYDPLALSQTLIEPAIFARETSCDCRAPHEKLTIEQARRGTPGTHLQLSHSLSCSLILNSSSHFAEV